MSRQISVLNSICCKFFLSASTYCAPFKSASPKSDIIRISEQNDHTFTLAEVAEKINEVAEQNEAAGANISIRFNEDDIVIGKWVKIDEDEPNSKFHVERNYTGPDAVKVTARRDDKKNSPITTFFAKIFNIDTMNISAVATAALTGPAKIAKGELTLPIGISEILFIERCEEIETIEFYPTGDSCAGWHNFFDQANANKLDAKMIGLIEGHKDCDICKVKGLTVGHDWLLKNHKEYYTSSSSKDVTSEVTPEISVGDEIEFIGGTLSNLIPNTNSSAHIDSTYDGNEGGIIPNGEGKAPAPFPNLFDYFRYRDGDGDDSVWTAFVPVYEEEGKCSNPKKEKILGFATIIVKGSAGPPIKNVEAEVLCDLSVAEGRGGGGTFGGLKGSIPNLVE